MKTKDNSRTWMWWFLGVGGALQLYFVRELLAAFALFAAVFAVFGVVIATLYMLQKAWAVGVERVAESGHPMVNMAKRSVSAVEDMARRPLRLYGLSERQLLKFRRPVRLVVLEDEADRVRDRRSDRQHHDHGVLWLWGSRRLFPIGMNEP